MSKRYMRLAFSAPHEREVMERFVDFCRARGLRPHAVIARMAEYFMDNHPDFYEQLFNGQRKSDP